MEWSRHLQHFMKSRFLCTLSSGIAPHCLDEGTVQTIVTEDINGKEWEKAVKEHKTIRDMSKP